MEQREPGWHADPWQEGLERRWDGQRWTADVRDPGAGPEEGGSPGAYGASATPVPAADRPATDPYGASGVHGATDADGASTPYGAPDEQADPRPSRISDAERAAAAHEARAPGDPTFAGMPWGRYDDDPRSRRTTALLIRSLWGIAIAFGVLLIIWLII